MLHPIGWGVPGVEMKRFVLLALPFLLHVVLAQYAAAAEYAALKGKDSYVGGVLLFLNGDDAGGACAREFLPGICVSGLQDRWSWQAFLTTDLGADAMLLGGSADLILAHNFDDYDSENCEFAVWWLGAGASLLAYDDMYSDGQGVAVDGEELGLNVGMGYHWDELAFDMYVHYFPDGGSVMVSGGVSRAF